MAEEDVEEDAPKKKSMMMPMLIGLVLALVCGGGGFYVMYSGMLGGKAPVAGSHETEELPPQRSTDVAFVALDPMIISLGAGGSNRHLRFSAQLEVTPKAENEVSHLIPRVVDVLNGYLRAVDAADLENPTALIRLRAQMLRPGSGGRRAWPGARPFDH